MVGDKMETETKYYIFYEQANTHINAQNFCVRNLAQTYVVTVLVFYSGLESRIVTLILFL